MQLNGISRAGWGLLLGVVLFGCGESEPEADAMPPDAARMDAEPTADAGRDAGDRDASRPDSGANDAGAHDSGRPDAGPTDCANDNFADRLPPGGFSDFQWRDPGVAGWPVVDVTEHGVRPGAGDVAPALRSLLSGLDAPTVLSFPAGTYELSSGGAISIRSRVVLRGAGSDQTILQLGNGAARLAFQGYDTDTEVAVTNDVEPGGTTLTVASTDGIDVGDFVRVEQDNPEAPRDWAARAWGAAANVVSVDRSANTITLDVPFALGLQTEHSPVVILVVPAQDSGIEHLRVERMSEAGSSTFFFNRARNCFLDDVASHMSDKHHVSVDRSHEIYIGHSFFDDAWDKAGGQGYGVLVQLLSTRVMVVDNILRNLRHQLATQAGSSYVVFAYNYIVDTVRDRCFAENPPICSDRNRLRDELNAWRESDIVLHGNYPHSALFEGNVFYWAWYDPIHGPNGPHNVMFRNRGRGQPDPYGSWMHGIGVSIAEGSAGATVVGNELLNGSRIAFFEDMPAPDTVIGANVLSGAVQWGDVPEDRALGCSLYLDAAPAFWPSDLAWPPFGPDTGDDNTIPAARRYLAGE